MNPPPPTIPNPTPTTNNNHPSLRTLNQTLAQRTPQDRIQWAINQYKNRLILTSSFGAQAAVTLHLTTTLKPDIPIILIDTGYLFPETYQFIDQLTQRLNLNLHIYRSKISPAWQETRHGKLWQQGTEGIKKYNQINKIEPMKHALTQTKAQAWISGIRRTQSPTRQTTPILQPDGNCLKIHPIIDWTDRHIHQYLKQHNLPYHPLWHQGYLSIGDTHTTHKIQNGMTPQQTRFFGLKRECGLHEGINTDYSI